MRNYLYLVTMIFFFFFGGGGVVVLPILLFGLEYPFVVWAFVAPHCLVLGCFTPNCLLRSYAVPLGVVVLLI